MTARPEEQLSALIDGELASNESELVVRRVARDEALKATALRYCLIGDAMRDELPASAPADLVGRVRAGLGGAEAPGRPRRHWGRYAAGFGVAASVAVLSLVSLRGDRPVSEVPVSATEVAAPAPGSTYMAPPVYTRAAAAGPDRLTRYYINHSEYSPLMGGRSALSRIVVRTPSADDDAGVRVQPVNAPR